MVVPPRWGVRVGYRQSYGPTRSNESVGPLSLEEWIVKGLRLSETVVQIIQRCFLKDEVLTILSKAWTYRIVNDLETKGVNLLVKNYKKRQIG